MENNNKIKDWKTFAFWIMIVVIILLSIYVYFFTKTEGFQCMADSGKYFINNIDKSTDGKTTCSCYVISNESVFRFTLNEKGITIT